MGIVNAVKTIRLRLWKARTKFRPSTIVTATVINADEDGYTTLQVNCCVIRVSDSQLMHIRNAGI